MCHNFMSVCSTGERDFFGLGITDTKTAAAATFYQGAPSVTSPVKAVMDDVMNGGGGGGGGPFAEVDKLTEEDVRERSPSLERAR